MIHMPSLGKRFVAGIFSLALLFCLAACEPSSTEETIPAASPTPEAKGQTVMAPVSSSPVETARAQEDQDPPEGQGTSPDAETANPPEVRTASIPYSEEALEKKLTSILNSIITDGMSKLEQARAVFKYVNYHIRFVGNTDKSDWQKGAYEGLTMGRGDCFTYYAASRALLTALDIDNLEVRRDGGTTDHYWNLVNCGDGWYHFDTCPRNVKMEGFDGFMFTDEEAAAYSALREDIPNFYSFDASLYPDRVDTPSSDEDLDPELVDTPENQPQEGSTPPADGIDGEVEPLETDPAAENPDPGESSLVESSSSTVEKEEEAPFIPFPVGSEPLAEPSEVPTDSPSENP